MKRSRLELRRRSVRLHVSRLTRSGTKDPFRRSVSVRAPLSVLVVILLSVQTSLCPVRVLLSNLVSLLFSVPCRRSGAVRCRFSTEKPSSGRNLRRTCGRMRRSSSARSRTRSSGPTSEYETSPGSEEPVHPFIGTLNDKSLTKVAPPTYKQQKQLCSDGTELKTFECPEPADRWPSSIC